MPTGDSSRKNDTELVAALLGGNSATWEEFVDSYGRIIRSRVADVAGAFQLAGDHSAIDDATADVFAALLADDAAALRAFASRSSLVTYIAVIATRCATRGFARRRPRTASDKQLELRTAASQSRWADPASQLISSEQRAELFRLLDELPEKQQHVVRLFYLEGRGYSEISELLDMPIGSVGVTLQRAQQKLRQRLEPD